MQDITQAKAAWDLAEKLVQAAQARCADKWQAGQPLTPSEQSELLALRSLAGQRMQDYLRLVKGSDNRT